MATVSITKWKPLIVPQVPEGSWPMMEWAVREAAIEFCEETHLWTYDLTRIDVEEDTQDYTLTVPSSQYAELEIIDSVKYKQNGQDDDQFVTLDPLSVNQADLEDSGSWIFLTSPTPSHFWVDNEDQELHLWRIPTVDSDEGLLVKTVLKPNDSCATLPDFLYNEHRRCIANGALSKLFGMKAMPWYDPVLSTEKMQLFNDGYNQAKWKKINGGTKRAAQVRMREFI